MAARYLSFAELCISHPGQKEIDLDIYLKRNPTHTIKTYARKKSFSVASLTLPR